MKTMSELISWFQLEYPTLVNEMKAANHHLTAFDCHKNGLDHSKAMFHPESLNPYHLESDVFTHTMMVCKQAENAPYEVRIAALLHDIGKPSTRKINAKNGRVSFFNHDAVSAFMALEIMNREELMLTKSMRIRIFNTIALHTQVFKQTPDQLARTCTNDPMLEKLILGLGKCDDAGRFTSVPSETIKESEMGSYCNIPVESKKEVVILCGLPGSGKSAYIKEKLPNSVVISRDNCLMDLGSQHFQAKEFTYNQAWDAIDQKEVDKILQIRFNTCKFAGELGKRIVIDMTHMSKKSRRRSLSHFGNDYKKKCVVFLPDMNDLYLRLSKRHGKIIGTDVVEKMMRSFYPPTLEEFDEIEYVV